MCKFFMKNIIKILSNASKIEINYHFGLVRYVKSQF